MKERNSENDFISDPKSFFEKPFTHLESGILPASPSIDLLKILPTFINEAGIVHIKDKWYGLKGSEMGIPSWMIPSSSDIFIHSHTISPREDEAPGYIPSLRDYRNCSPHTRNLIVSAQGITEYLPVQGWDNVRRLEGEIYSGRMDQAPVPEYLRFLGDIEARFKLTTWNAIDEKKLTVLLAPLASTASQ